MGTYGTTIAISGRKNKLSFNVSGQPSVSLEASLSHLSGRCEYNAFITRTQISCVRLRTLSKKSTRLQVTSVIIEENISDYRLAFRFARKAIAFNGIYFVMAQRCMTSRSAHWTLPVSHGSHKSEFRFADCRRTIKILLHHILTYIQCLAQASSIHHSPHGYQIARLQIDAHFLIKRDERNLHMLCENSTKWNYMYHRCVNDN